MTERFEPTLRPPLGTARIRTEPADFQVFEQLSFEPAGHGEHRFIRVRKTGWNTEAVARLLAECAGVHRRAVSFAGQKDRHAITEQWFSIQQPEATAHDAIRSGEDLADGVTVVTTTRNDRKLRKGALSGNRFRITLRDFDGSFDALARRVVVLSHEGVPNYFGPQRFGHNGRNRAQVRQWLLDGRPVRGRNLRGLLLSAARAELFNRVLGDRVADGTWAQLLPGERAMLDGRKSHFAVDAPTPDLIRRCEAGALHPTGPLPGLGDGDGDRDAPRLDVAAREAAVLADDPLAHALRARGIRADRRALRVRAGELGVAPDDAGAVVVCFDLPAGAYATSVLREFVAFEDATAPNQRRGPRSST